MLGEQRYLDLELGGLRSRASAGVLHPLDASCAHTRAQAAPAKPHPAAPLRLICVTGPKVCHGVGLGPAKTAGKGASLLPADLRLRLELG